MLEQLRRYSVGDLSQPLAPQQEAQEPVGWDGAEEWEKLAWRLCAEENGEDACNELIWEGGPIPEPWGERWLSYEDEARRMIDLVRTHVPAPQPAPHLPERDASIPAERQGLFRKFVVGRVDGSDKPGGKHHGCTYFVLDVDHDPCARPALAAYAAACESTHPTLAADLRTKWGVVPAPQPAPAPASESIDQLARKLEIIGVVGAIDGHDVVRRESVLEIARRAALAAQGGKDMNSCKFVVAWRGRCGSACQGQVCEQHEKVKCCVCGEQATHECDHSGQFVCGAPLCNNCEGHTDTSKPAGGWGFMNHTHRQKDPS